MNYVHLEEIVQGLGKLFLLIKYLTEAWYSLCNVQTVWTQGLPLQKITNQDKQILSPSSLEAATTIISNRWNREIFSGTTPQIYGPRKPTV